MYKQLLEKNNIAVLLGGLPGTGKTTIAQKFISKGFLNACKDDIRYFFAKQQYGDMPESLLEDKLIKYGKCCRPILDSLVESYFAKKAITTPISNSKLSAAHKDIAIRYINSFDYSNLRGIVFDATHFNSKQRKNELNCIDNRMPVYAVYINKTVNEAYDGVQLRVKQTVNYNNQIANGRDVPIEVITDMARFSSLPKKSEGFCDVFIIDNKF